MPDVITEFQERFDAKFDLAEALGREGLSPKISIVTPQYFGHEAKSHSRFRSEVIGSSVDVLDDVVSEFGGMFRVDLVVALARALSRQHSIIKGKDFPAGGYPTWAISQFINGKLLGECNLKGIAFVRNGLSRFAPSKGYEKKACARRVISSNLFYRTEANARSYVRSNFFIPVSNAVEVYK